MISSLTIGPGDADEFWDLTPKSKASEKQNINNQDSNKYTQAKNLINETKRQPTNMIKYFSNYMFY